MRISDWSSDVCSSDLYSTGALFPSLHTIMDGTGLSKNCVVQALSRLKDARIIDWFRRYEPVPDHEAQGAGPRIKQATHAYRFLRSEERRVGNECVSPCRYRWSR